MSFSQLNNSIHLFTQPFSVRCGFQENPCLQIVDLERDHAPLTEIYNRTLRNTQKYFKDNVGDAIRAKTTLLGGINAVIFTPLLLISGPIGCVAWLGTGFAISVGFGYIAGRAETEISTLPELKQAFQIEVNWIQSVYPRIESAISRTPLFDPSASRTQLLVLKSHFDQVLQTSSQMNLANLGLAYGSGVALGLS